MKGVSQGQAAPDSGGRVLFLPGAGIASIAPNREHAIKPGDSDCVVYALRDWRKAAPGSEAGAQGDAEPASDCWPDWSRWPVDPDTVHRLATDNAPRNVLLEVGAGLAIAFAVVLAIQHMVPL